MSDRVSDKIPLLKEVPFDPAETSSDNANIQIRKKRYNRHCVIITLLIALCVFLSIGLITVASLLAKSEKVTSKSKRDAKSLSHFFHISDTHLDIYYGSNITSKNYQGCRNKRNINRLDKPIGLSDTTAIFGRINCDSPDTLLASAKSHLKKLRDGFVKDVDFVLLTGDQSAHAYQYFDVDVMDSVIWSISNSTKYISDAFPQVPIIIAVGNNDLKYDYQPPVGNFSRFYQTLREIFEPLIFPLGSPIDNLNSKEEFKDTFDFGGFYKVYFNGGKMVLLVLNTNYWSRKSYDVKANVTVIGDIQMKWLDDQLNAAKSIGLRAIINGHIPPGCSVHDQNNLWLSNYTNVYNMLVTMKYSDIIAGQLYGHIHSDRIKMQYLDDVHVSNKPTDKSFLLTCPSITPIYGINPAFRVFDYDTGMRKLVDYTQYYLDLAASNVIGEAVWVKEYSFFDTYNVDLSIEGVEKIVNDFLNPLLPTWFYYSKHVKAMYGGVYDHQRYIEYCAARHISLHAFKKCVDDFKDTGGT